MSLLDRLARRLKPESADQERTAGGTATAAAKTPAPAERRKDPRHGLGAPTMVVRPGDPSGVRAFIRDISKGGCLLDTEAPVAVGTRLSLAFLSKACGHCHAIGQVVRVADARSFGVQFSKVNMAFLGFVGSVSSASPEGKSELIAAMRGSTIAIEVGA